jgi:hypothetical protein
MKTGIHKSSFNLKQASFDLGLGHWLLYIEFQVKHGDKSSRKYARKDFHWVDQCKEVFAHAKDAAGKFGFPEWLISSSFYFDSQEKASIRRQIADSWGKNIAEYHKLGRLVWEVVKAPQMRGYFEELNDFIANFRIPDEVTSVVSSWVSSFTEEAILDPEKVPEFLNYLREVIMHDLAQPKQEVFISHSHIDIELATELANEFEKKGVLCFLAPRDIPSGDLWSEDIRQALYRCSELLAIVTPNSKFSPWLMIEAGAAWSEGKIINIGYAYVDLKELPAKRLGDIL